MAARACAPQPARPHLTCRREPACVRGPRARLLPHSQTPLHTQRAACVKPLANTFPSQADTSIETLSLVAHAHDNSRLRTLLFLQLTLRLSGYGTMARGRGRGEEASVLANTCGGAASTSPGCVSSRGPASGSAATLAHCRGSALWERDIRTKLQSVHSTEERSAATM